MHAASCTLGARVHRWTGQEQEQERSCVGPSGPQHSALGRRTAHAPGAALLVSSSPGRLVSRSPGCLVDCTGQLAHTGQLARTAQLGGVGADLAGCTLLRSCSLGSALRASLGSTPPPRHSPPNLDTPLARSARDRDPLFQRCIIRTEIKDEIVEAMGWLLVQARIRMRVGVVSLESGMT